MPQYVGGPGDDTVNGGIGPDELYGFNGNDALNGVDGNDYLDGGQGADLMHGGAGDDIYIVDNPGDGVLEQFAEGSDTVYSSMTFLLGPNVENLSLTGTVDINGTGNELDNWLAGNAESNVIDGAQGNDTMAGGAGDDVYVADSTGDIVAEFPAEGNDIVRASATFALSADVETLILIGDAAICGTGNDSANYLVGNSAANVLSGRNGADVLTGGGGSDTFLDTAGDHNGDMITDFERGDRIVFSDATLEGFIYSLSGNTLTYGAGSITLSGLHNASLAASRAPEGGVQIAFTSPPIVYSPYVLPALKDLPTTSQQIGQTTDVDRIDAPKPLPCDTANQHDWSIARHLEIALHCDSELPWMTYSGSPEVTCMVGLS